MSSSSFRANQRDPHLQNEKINSATCHRSLGDLTHIPSTPPNPWRNKPPFSKTCLYIFLSLLTFFFKTHCIQSPTCNLPSLIKNPKLACGYEKENYRLLTQRSLGISKVYRISKANSIYHKHWSPVSKWK